MPVKEDFYNSLSIAETTDSDDLQPKRICKDIKAKKMGECQDLYLKGDASLLADVLENLSKMCLKI